jgi:hypothetical protein
VSFYTTGYQLGVLIPADNSSTFNKIRVFSMLDGKHVDDFKIKSEPLSKLANPLSTYLVVGLCTCYDSVRNVIWTYADNQFEIWKNLGLAPQHNNSGELYPLFSPEAILSKKELSLPSSQGENLTLLPLQAVLLILGNMDRLARQHPIYGDKIDNNM